MVDNPKDLIGNTKLPLELVPATAMAQLSLALLDGACKYGRWNWRAAGINASIYVAAAIRHLEKWMNGEDCDEDSGLSHLAHALATISIIVDAEAANKLNDDRAPKIDISEYFIRLTEKVTTIKTNHINKTPYHYSIRDTESIKDNS